MVPTRGHQEEWEGELHKFVWYLNTFLSATIVICLTTYKNHETNDSGCLMIFRAHRNNLTNYQSGDSCAC